jgi:Pyridoxamine 5'-phosphate oxidase
MNASERSAFEPRYFEPLSRSESMRLLGSVPFGRVMFTQQALPAMRPVTHLVVDDLVVIRTSLRSGAGPGVTADGGTVLGYQADLIDARSHLGWSVTVVGMARLIDAAAERARYNQRLRQWVSGQPDEIIAIDADLVTGHVLTPGTGPPRTQSEL